jgi:hypothetical protein
MSFSTVISILAALFLTACTAAAPAPPQASPPDNELTVNLPAPPPPPPDRLDAAIDAGLRFLEGQYNAELGLLQESPNIGAYRYFLANDALLAAHVFETMGDADLAATLRATLAAHGIDGNKFIEVAWGEPIPWPPLHFEDPGTRVEVQGDVRILTLIHDGPGYFYDWSAYSNLAFMAVLNELSQGYAESAARLFAMQMGTFDGYGFPDKAYHARDGHYETLGLALGALAAAKLCSELTLDSRALIDQLLAQQSPETGGFHTHFRVDANQLADPNVETTSVALLALHVLSQGDCLPRVAER